MNKSIDQSINKIEKMRIEEPFETQLFIAYRFIFIGNKRKACISLIRNLNIFTILIYIRI